MSQSDTDRIIEAIDRNTKAVDALHMLLVCLGVVVILLLPSRLDWCWWVKQ